MSEIKEEYYLKEKYDLEEILNPLYNQSKNIMNGVQKEAQKIIH